MSDLGNRGWPNSMKLGEDVDLGELLLDIQLYLSSFRLPFTFSGGGGPILGSQSTEKHPYAS